MLMRLFIIQDDDCKFFEWFDPDESKHTKEMMRSLIKEKETLNVELNHLKRRMSFLL